jgi:hypothetical protein
MSVSPCVNFDMHAEQDYRLFPAQQIAVVIFSELIQLLLEQARWQRACEH